MSGSEQHPWDMVLPQDVHFRGRMTITTKMGKVIDLINRKLTKAQLELFRESMFGKFLDVDYTFSGQIMHNVLCKRVVQAEEDGEDQLWFRIGGELIRFSIREWCLITGLNCGPKHCPKATTTRIRNKYFPKHKGIRLMDIDNIFSKLNFSNIPNQDALMIALYYFGDRALLARPEKNSADDNIMGLMDDKAAFESITWGRYSWEKIYEYSLKSMKQKADKFEQKKIAKPLAKEQKYTFYGFVHGFQAWIFEALGGLAAEYAVRLEGTRYPRLCQWKLKKQPDDKGVTDLLDKPADVLNPKRVLNPSNEEMGEPYWASVATIVAVLPNWVSEYEEQQGLFVKDDAGVFHAPDPLGVNVVTNNPTTEFHALLNEQHDNDEGIRSHGHDGIAASSHSLSDRGFRPPSPHDETHIRSLSPPAREDSSGSLLDPQYENAKMKFSNDSIVRRLDQIWMILTEENNANNEFRQKVAADIAALSERQTTIEQSVSQLVASLNNVSAEPVPKLSLVRSYSDPSLCTPAANSSDWGPQDVPVQEPGNVSRYRRRYMLDAVVTIPFMAIPPFKKPRLFVEQAVRAPEHEKASSWPGL